MNKGQEQFFDFIVERAQDDQKETAKSMLLHAFTSQKEGRFLKEDLEQFHNKILTLLKPQFKDEVATVMNQFGNQHTNKE